MCVGLAVSLSAARTYADDLFNDPNAPANNSPLTDQQFVSQAAQGSDKEIYLSQLALQKSQNSDVRHFAQEMIRDHSKSNTQLAQIASREGLSMPPDNYAAIQTPDNGYVVTRAPENGVLAARNRANPANADNEAYQKPAVQLEMPPITSPKQTVSVQQPVAVWQSLSGPDFDHAYANAAVKDHQNDIALFQNASQSLQDRKLRKYAQKSLPTLREHYRMAQDLQDKVNGQGSTNTGNETKSRS